MTAKTTVNTKPKGTAEIAAAAEAWVKTANQAAEAYAALRTGVSAEVASALAQAGVEPGHAENYAHEFHKALLDLQLAFVSVAEAAEVVCNDRNEMVAAVKAHRQKAAGESGTRPFRVVA